MENRFEIIDVNLENVEKTGFFCYMSKRKSPGYRQKLEWLEERFAEGMKIKIIHEVGGRDVAFIEYIPAEYTWRALHAPGYMAIHCLWVVGKGKRKGYGTHLLQACLEDARLQNKHGVVMVSSDGNWLAGKKLFLHNGFVQVDQAQPSFQLLVQRFGSAPDPSFPQDWRKRLDRFGPGLTVVRTTQCPYLENATNSTLQIARELGLASRVVELKSAQEVQESAPCPYGVFAIAYNGQLLSYYYLDRDGLEKRLEKTR
ncbi:MAG TPA: GNAT family N-acetyltransferase [Anaerolineales bacterium]|nr:GNAT family N-acetyltransferase [Anaerolineales bacterium]